MTSQGVGKPFGPGEKLFGYQACGLKGVAYIGPDEIFGEKLMNLSPGDEAVFRYVKNERDWTKTIITCAGSGTIQVLLNGTAAGTAEVTGEPGKIQTFSAEIAASAGESELILRVKESDGLEIMEIVLE